MPFATSNQFNLEVTVPDTPGTSILSTRTDVGFSDGSGYDTINGGFYSGTKHFFTDSTSIATINADSSIVSGDQVLFQAGGVWSVVSSMSNKLKCKSGVLYGRYGNGANPKFRNTTVQDAVNFQGVIEVNNVNNVVIDGLDVTDGMFAPGSLSKGHFGIYAVNSDNVTVRRLTVGKQPTATPWYNGAWAVKGGGIIMGVGTTNCLVEFCEVTMTQGGPHESIAFTGTDGYTCRYNYSHHNSHAGINNKGNSKNGVIYGNEIHNIFDDPSLYVERAENLVLRDNWVHDNQPDPGTGKVMMAVNVEDLPPNNSGSPESTGTKYNRNIELYNNVIVNGQSWGSRTWIKPQVNVSYTQLQHDIHFHHNTYVNCGLDFGGGFMARDGRDAAYGTSVDLSDWTQLFFENNIIWITPNGAGQDYQTNLLQRFTNRNNLYQTGEGGGTDNGSNPTYTSSEPFVDRANNDYTPSGAAVGAGHDGSDVGATIIWGENSWL